MKHDDEMTTPEQIEKFKAALEAAFHRPPRNTDWLYYFDDRQRELIRNCRLYAENDPAGLPGHNLMMIIHRMADLLDGVKLVPMEQE